MKVKKYCILGILGIVVFFAIAIFNNHKDNFVKDNILFAVTLDGKTINYFPERGKYYVSISCKNGIGKWLPEDWKFVVENVTGNVSCNLDFVSTPDNLIKLVADKANSNENGYRYSGFNPNNYINFNDETWRIIGSIPTRNINGTTENLVKIIRDESLGTLIYNKLSEGATSWGSNTLYSILNDYYYGKKDGTDYEGCFSYSNISRSKCDYRTNGILNTDFYGKMVEQVYWNTGNVTTSKTPSEIFAEESSIQSVLGHVGLMSVSDFLYSSKDTNYSDSTGFSDYKNIWLTGRGTEWMISSRTGTTSGNTFIYFDNYSKKFVSDVFITGNTIRPVVYLDSSVYVVSGNGTEANPYQIAM